MHKFFNLFNLQQIKNTSKMRFACMGRHYKISDRVHNKKPNPSKICIKNSFSSLSNEILYTVCKSVKHHFY